MRRRPSCVLLAPLLAIAVVASGCSGNSGHRNPTGSTSPPTGASTEPTTTTPASTAPGPTTASATKATSTISTAPTSAITIPKVAPSAQPAVDNYIAFLRAEYLVGQDPGEIRRGDMTMYLGAKALKSVNAQLDAMAAAGTAFRGNPDNPRVTLDFIASSKLVVLNSCPLPAKTDPYHVIKVSTGATVVPPKQNPPPPYELRILMFLNKKGRWVLINSTADTSRTCTG